MTERGEKIQEHFGKLTDEILEMFTKDPSCFSKRHDKHESPDDDSEI